MLHMLNCKFNYADCVNVKTCNIHIFLGKIGLIRASRLTLSRTVLVCAMMYFTLIVVSPCVHCVHCTVQYIIPVHGQ